MAKTRAPVTANNDSLQQFNLGGAVIRVAANAATWTEVPVSATCDSILIDVPATEHTVSILWMSGPAPAAIDPAEVTASWPLRPGTHSYGIERPTGIKLYVALTAVAGNPPSPSVTLVVLENATVA